MPAPSPAPVPRRRRRALRTLLILFVLLAAVTALLPAMLSTAPARDFLLARMSQKTGVRIDASSLRLTWASGLELRGLVVVQPLVSTTRVEQVTVERGLWPILRDRNAGLVTLSHPEISLAAAAGRPSSAAPASTPGAGPAQPADGPMAAGRRFDWPAWTVSLRIQEGVVTLPAGPAGKMERIEDISADASLASRPPRFELKAAARNASTGGRLDLRLLSSSAGDSDLTLDDIRHEGVFECAGMQIQPLLMLVPSLPVAMANSEGQAGASLRFRGSGVGNVTVSGAADVDDLRVRGVFPAGDEPLVDRLQIGLQGAVTNGIPTNINVNVTTSFLRMQANQDPRAAGIGDRINLIAAVDAPSLAALLPRTLRLRPDVKIDSGNLLVRGQLEVGSNVQVRLLAQLPDLKGRMGADALALDEPVSVDADVRWGVDGLDLKLVRLRSGFANLEAAGHPGQLSATGSLDLRKALAQAGTFLQLGPRKLAGELGFSLTTRWADDLSLDGVSVKADARDFSWSAPGGPEILDEDFAVEIGLNRGPLPGWSDASISLTASNRHVSVAAGGQGFDLRKFPGETPRLTVTARADLGGVSRWNPGGSKMAGRLVLAPMQAVREKGVWTSPRVKMLLAGLEIPVGSLPIVLEEVDVETELRWDENADRLELQGFNALADGLRLRSAALRLPVSPFRLSALQGSATIDVEMGVLADRLRPLFPGLIIRSAAGNVRMLATAADGLFSAAVNIGGLKLDLPVLARPLVEPAFSARATVAVSTNGAWRADAFEVSSSMLGLLGSAVLTPPENGRQGRLEVSGDLTYDLAALAGMIPGLAESGVRVAGKDSRSFRIGLPVGEASNSPPVGATFEIDLAADHLGAGDFLLEELRIPARLADGRLSIDATARVGQTALNLLPRVTMGEPAVLTWQAKPPVMDGLPLSDALAAQVLSRIHPIFKGASGLQGRASLHLDSVNVPLGKNAQKKAAFTGRLILSKTSLRADGWFDEILDLAKIREREVDLGTQTITFTCAQGRITTTPLRATLGKLAMVLEGHMGLDQSMDYTITVPVTEELVGRKVAAYLPGKQVQIPIGGTLQKPRVDRDRFRTEVERLAREAGTKALENETDDLIRKLLEKNLK